MRYGAVLPHQLRATLETKKISGLLQLVERNVRSYEKLLVRIIAGINTL